MTPQKPRKRRLFWRIYLYGLLLLLVASLTGVVARSLFAPVVGAPADKLELLAEWELSRWGEEPQDDPQRLERLQAFSELDLSLYTKSGTWLGGAGESPPMAPDPEELATLEGKERSRLSPGLVALPLKTRAGEDLVLVVAWDPQKGKRHLLVVLATMLGLCALVFYPLARGLARPLERIASATEAFGQGRLEARSEVARRDEIGAVALAFDQMAERITALLHSERELLANISHEFRTPMARIRVALELCAEDELEPGELRANLQAIEEDIMELDQLVEEVLTASRLDLAKGDAVLPQVKRRSISPAQLVGSALSRFARISDEPVEVDVASGLPAVELDHKLMERVLVNLLENAAKHGVLDSDRGHVSSPASNELDAEKRANPDRIFRALLGTELTRSESARVPTRDRATIRLSVRAAPSLTFEVSDHGPGVAEAELSRLFEPFFQADRSRRVGGVGIGLTLCKRIVEAHAGRIQAANREGGGLAVTVVLPS